MSHNQFKIGDQALRAASKGAEQGADKAGLVRGIGQNPVAFNPNDYGMGAKTFDHQKDLFEQALSDTKRPGSEQPDALNRPEKDKMATDKIAKDKTADTEEVSEEEAVEEEISALKGLKFEEEQGKFLSASQIIMGQIGESTTISKAELLKSAGLNAAKLQEAVDKVVESIKLSNLNALDGKSLTLKVSHALLPNTEIMIKELTAGKFQVLMQTSDVRSVLALSQGKDQISLALGDEFDVQLRDLSKFGSQDQQQQQQGNSQNAEEFTDEAQA